MQYRMYLLDEQKHIRVGESFSADGDQEASTIAASVHSACDDTFPAYEVCLAARSAIFSFWRRNAGERQATTSGRRAARSIPAPNPVDASHPYRPEAPLRRAALPPRFLLCADRQALPLITCEAG
jgi:hypothetical protein